MYGPRVCRPHRSAFHDRAWRRVPATDGLGRRIAHHQGQAPYAVSKHAAVAFAEWLSITHAHQGIKVSCLCPFGVISGMLPEDSEGIGKLILKTAITPEECADYVVAALEKEEFFIFPHPEILDYFKARANNHERWLRHMRREQQQYVRL